ncbi:hypothetical protein HNQ01_001723 [Leptothrix sp. C29]|uniref:VWFA domain-containing protein n=1 Tax=Sphaerotilus uruguayifluvii TaxID=2735897 RepID=A0ABX2G3F6_9BURK|nr:hypothetical protein [Leptothrix sp. C29]
MPASGVVSVPAGSTSFLVRIPTLDDTVYEGNETLTLQAKSPFDTAPASGIGTITDAADLPKLSINDVVVNEGAGTATFTVTLTGATTQTTTVAFATADGTAKAGSDYTAVSGTLTFAPGETTKTITVPILNDAVYEGPESFTVNLSAPTNAVIADGSGLGTIKDDGTGPGGTDNDLNFSLAVSEEGLSGGIKDTSAAGGATDTTDSAVYSGTVSLASTLTGAGVTMTWQAAGTQPDLYSSATGTKVSWSVSSDGHTLTGTADGSTILTAVMNDNGSYTVTLAGAVRHAGAGEDVLSVGLKYGATSGGYTGYGTATVSIEDDAPAPIANQHDTVTLQDTNLLVVLDTSGSMLSTLTTGALAGQTRLDAAISAIKSLLASYSEFGTVMVQLVTFSDTASTPNSTWMTVGQAQTLLDSLSAGGETNYDAALAAAQTAYASSGKLASGQNVTYFFSDGNPTAPSGSIGVSASEEANWSSWLATNQMNAYAIGMTSDVVATALDPIAWTTTSGTSASSVIVTDLNQLSSVLQSTVPTPTGDLATGGEIRSGGLVGADGAYIHSVTIDGITYSLDSATDRTISATGGTSAMQSFDASTKVLVVNTAQGGKFIVDMDDGTYEYTVPASVATSNHVATETMSYVLSDKDGDTQSATVTVQVNDPTLVGTIGGDLLNGDATRSDYIVGGAGNDTLHGLGGDDHLVGGRGDDLLAGGLGNDVFAWSLNDQGAKGAPAVDTISDFDVKSDILDLRDLLVGEGSGAGNTVGNLANYLDFSVIGSGGSATTTIHVSTSGAFASGYSAAAEDQTIVLQGVDLPGSLGLTSGATDAQIITALLTQGKLVVDPASGS